MRLDDIPAVYRLGHQLFHSLELSTLYRTWDAYEVTTNFNQDPRLSLVATAGKGRIMGFALGPTYEKESGGWRYGHLLWMGVSPRWQGKGVGRQLYHEAVLPAFVRHFRPPSGAACRSFPSSSWENRTTALPSSRSALPFVQLPC